MVIFLILLFIFFIWPIIRISIAVNRAKKQARQAYEAMRGGMGSADSRRQPERKAGWSAPAMTKKKKIERGVGDYVAYEELPAAPETASARSASYSDRHASEPQISDADWEEIK